MKQEHVLSILYELAMVLSGETRSSPLVDRFLQRLMFHTGFPCGLYLSHISQAPESENRLNTAYLKNAIGDPELAEKCGQPLSLPTALTQGKSIIIEDQTLLSNIFGKTGGWRTALILQVSEDSVFILLSPESLRSDLPFTSMFDPVLRNFTKVLNLCYANEEHMKELEIANKELEAFCHSVSHDLRAPLRSIDGFSQVLQEDCGEQLSEDGRDSLQRVRNGVKRMDMLITDLLKLSHTTQATLSFKLIDMTSLAKKAFEDLHDGSPERHVDVKIEDNLKVTADPALLGVALDNLFSNAWKYTGKKQQAVIEFGAKIKNMETIFYVKDNGAGFDMQHADKLFGVFQRLHRAKEFAGTGVGLATVQRVIHRHGGEIWAEAKPDEGATFFFTLPVLMKNIKNTHLH